MQTHEEAVSSIVAASVPLSYKRLPIRLYQVYVLCLIAFVSIIITLGDKLFNVCPEWTQYYLVLMTPVNMFFLFIYNFTLWMFIISNVVLNF